MPEWSDVRRERDRSRGLAAESERNRKRRQSAEELLWNQTSAAYAAEQSTPADDDLLRPVALRGPSITFTDDELEDF